VRSHILFASTGKVHKPRPHCFLHVGIRNIHQIRMVDLNVCARRLLPANMLERWPHVCCVKITFELLPTSWFDSTQSTRNSMKCPVNWIPVRICLCSTGREVLHPTIENLISKLVRAAGVRRRKLFLLPAACCHTRLNFISILRLVARAGQVGCGWRCMANATNLNLCREVSAGVLACCARRYPIPSVSDTMEAAPPCPFPSQVNP